MINCDDCFFHDYSYSSLTEIDLSLTLKWKKPAVVVTVDLVSLIPRLVHHFFGFCFGFGHRFLSFSFVGSW